ncbi:MAG: CDP-alcohol phosphatidyltransferase family protein [Alphaproteobacteria bacterium]|jgi:CDP-diacylglycerol--glycerol-3-phosphate 3-phosphatidyltransferase
MPSVYDLKPRFQELLRPLCCRLAAAGVTANQVTLYALLLSAAHGAWIGLTGGSLAALLALPATLLVRMALNAVDGMLAREHGMQSPLGALFNETGDMLSDAALYLPFALIAGIDPLAVVTALVLALIAEATGILGLSLAATRRYDGPWGKSDRAISFAALALLIAAVGPTTAGSVAWLFVPLAVITLVNRGRKIVHGAAEASR